MTSSDYLFSLIDESAPTSSESHANQAEIITTHIEIRTFPSREIERRSSRPIKSDRRAKEREKKKGRRDAANRRRLLRVLRKR